jgi:hypothetical protein
MGFQSFNSKIVSGRSDIIERWGRAGFALVKILVRQTFSAKPAPTGFLVV